MSRDWDTPTLTRCHRRLFEVIRLVIRSSTHGELRAQLEGAATHTLANRAEDHILGHDSSGFGARTLFIRHPSGAALFAPPGAEAGWKSSLFVVAAWVSTSSFSSSFSSSLVLAFVPLWSLPNTPRCSAPGPKPVEPSLAPRSHSHQSPEPYWAADLGTPRDRRSFDAT